MGSGLGHLLLGRALARGGLVALALLPVPPEILLPLAGFHVGQGHLGFLPSWSVATGASVVAAMPLYLVARAGGRPLLARHARALGLNARRIDLAERWFARWGEGAVLFGRMVTGVRGIVSVPAGLAGMAFARFALYTAVGFGTWNAVLLAAGWMLGDRWTEVVRHAPVAVPAVAGLGAAAALLTVIVRRRRARTGGPPGVEAAAP